MSGQASPVAHLRQKDVKQSILGSESIMKYACSESADRAAGCWEMFFDLVMAPLKAKGTHNSS